VYIQAREKTRMIPPVDASRNPLTKTHVPEFDGLRGIACLMVLLWHLVRLQIGHLSGWWGVVGLALSQAWSGVDLFFVLSGFLIIGSLLDRQHLPHQLQSFASARVFRLLPGYAALLAAFAAVRWFYSAHDQSNTIHSLLAGAYPGWVYACFGQSWVLGLSPQASGPTYGTPFLAVTWSLCAEMEYYVLAALVILYAPRNSRAAILVAMVLGAELFRAVMSTQASQLPLAVSVLPPARMDGFALGALAAFTIRSQTARDALRPVILPVWALLAVGFGFLTTLNSAPFGSFTSNFGYEWIDIFYAATLMLVALRSEQRHIRALGAGPLAWLGTISYSVYLCHQPVHALYTNLLGIPSAYLTLPEGLMYWLGDILAVLAVGLAGYLLVERPGIRLGARLRRAWRTDAMSASTFTAGPS
jgi:peptidoglycan/LPS O-acetylase OafA/YrhL